MLWLSRRDRSISTANRTISNSILLLTVCAISFRNKILLIQLKQNMLHAIVFLETDADCFIAAFG